MTLTKKDFARWENCLLASPATLEELKQWVDGPLRKFFPFERVALLYGVVSAGQVKIEFSISHGHTVAYLKHMGKIFDIAARKSLQVWLTEREPVLIDPADTQCVASALELREIEQFALKNIAAHGILSLKGSSGTYVSFAGVPGPLNSWHRDALNLIAPVINALLLKLIAKTAPLNVERLTASLTAQERRVTRAVLGGATDKQAAAQLGIATKTVRNHLTHIFNKLDVTNRSQLFARLR